MVSKTNRCKHELIASILTNCLPEQGEKKTNIMFNIKTNFRQITLYLSILVENGLLVKQGRRYKITEAGRKYLYSFKKLEATVFPGEENN